MMSISVDSRHDGSIDFLSGQDRLFLLSETPSTPMHVGAALVLEAGPLAKPNRAVDFSRIRNHILARLRYVPRYRQRVSFSPLPSRPHWIDDDRFDIDRHVRHLRLPQPGNDKQLKELCAHLFSHRLDPSRPLWELVVIEGLMGGRFALVAKTHHCLVDGVGGVNLLAALLDPSPTPASEPVGPWSPKPPPTALDVLRCELARRAERVFDFGKQLKELAEARPIRWVNATRQFAGIAEFLGTGLIPAPACPLNGTIGAQRRFEWLSFDLGDVKRLKACLGGTVNDVVLTVVAGALRTFLREERGEGRISDLRALVPVNMRQAGEEPVLGNHISAYLVSLPVTIANPRRRHRVVMERMLSAKASGQAIGGQILAGAGVPLLAALVRLAERLRPFNVVVTNVPGPPVDLYLAGARLQAVFPFVPLFLNQGLGIALFSYAGKLHWGLDADRDLVPDISKFALAVADAFEALRVACNLGRSAKPSEARPLPRPLRAVAS